MSENNCKIITRFYIILLAAVGVGSVLGALYYVNQYSGSEEIKNYLDGFIGSIKNGSDNMKIAARAFRGFVITAAVMCVCAAVRPGIIAISFIAVRQGFVYGFTNSAVMDGYGINGLFITLSRFPAFALAIISIAALGSINCAVASKRLEPQKKFKIFYLIFLTAVIAIFCAAGAAEGFISTTFMKLVPVSVT